MFDQEEAMLRWAGGNIDVSEVIPRLECPRCGCSVDTRGGDRAEVSHLSPSHHLATRDQAFATLHPTPDLSEQTISLCSKYDQSSCLFYLEVSL